MPSAKGTSASKSMRFYPVLLSSGNARKSQAQFDRIAPESERASTTADAFESIGLTPLSAPQASIPESIASRTADNASTDDELKSSKFSASGLPRRRLLDPECYLSGNTKRTIDFVLACQPNHAKSRAAIEREFRKRLYRQRFERKLEQLGLEIEHEGIKKSQDGKTCFVKIHAPLEFLTMHAEIMKMKLPMERFELDAEKEKKSSSTLEKIIRFCFRGRNPFRSTKVDVPSAEEVRYLTAKFDSEYADMFIVGKLKEAAFSSVQRIRLVYSVLQQVRVQQQEPRRKSAVDEKPVDEKEAGKKVKKDKKKKKTEKVDKAKKEKPSLPPVGLEWLLMKGVYCDAYPLHDSDAVYAREWENPFFDTPSERQPFRLWLSQNWANFHAIWKFQPLHQIRTYYGEQIAFYFAWLGFYTKMLIIPAFASLVCLFFGFGYVSVSPVVKSVCDYNHTDLSQPPFNMRVKRYEVCQTCEDSSLCPQRPLSYYCEDQKATILLQNPSTVVYSILLTIWSVCFLELWKRRQNELAAKWDAVEEEFEETPQRPQYAEKIKTKRLNPVSGEIEPYVTPRESMKETFVVLGVQLLFIGINIALTAAILVYRSFMDEIFYKAFASAHSSLKERADIFSAVTASLITCVIITTMERVYKPICWRLAIYQNPRTESELLENFAKMFLVFQFINYFAPLFYLAFLKGHFTIRPDEKNADNCPPTGCLIELCIHLFMVFIWKVVIINQLTELIGPWLFSRLRTIGVETKSTASNKFERWEKDFLLSTFGFAAACPMVYEYIDLIIQFGFVTMFAPVFPLSSLLALIANVISVRMNAKNLVRHFRRPVPMRTRDIQPWFGCLEFVTKMAVMTNALVIALTTDMLDQAYFTFGRPNAGISRAQFTFVNWTFYWFDRKHLRFLSAQATLNDSMPLQVNATNASLISMLANHAHHHSRIAEVEEPPAQYCLVRDYRYDDYVLPDNLMYQINTDWWKMLMIRLVFIFAYEHVISLLQALIGVLIENVPDETRAFTKRERALTRAARLKRAKINAATTQQRRDQQLLVEHK